MVRTILSAALVGFAVLSLSMTSQAQPGCTSRYGYWNGSGVTCTNQAGINCITCPR